MKTIPCTNAKGRYVWVVLRAKQQLTLCEVRVMTEDPKKGANIARGKPAQQSSTTQGGEASRAVDGNIDTIYAHGSCTHTHYDNEPWWMVDLETNRKIGGVQIWNRGDCCGSRLSNFEVRVGASTAWEKDAQCGSRHSVAQGRRKTIRCDGKEGRYVFIVIRGRSYLNLCEVRVLPYEGMSDGCVSEPLGLENRKLDDTMLSASSSADSKQTGPQNARLNYKGNPWTAMYKKLGEWLEVSLPKLTTISAVQVQGSGTASEWVSAYKVKYFDGNAWKWYKEQTKLDGAHNQLTPQKTRLEPFKATKVRLYPLTWHGAISMRVELFGHTCEDKTQQADSSTQVGLGPQCASKQDEYKCVPKRATELKINSMPGYGEGSAKLWYAQDKGIGNTDISAHSVYVDKDIDFRTQHGSIFSSQDVVAGRYVRIGAWPGYGAGAAQLRFSEKGTDGQSSDQADSNALFVDNANLHVQQGSIIGDQNVRAGKFLEISALQGHGDGVAQFWYSAVADDQFAGDTLYLKAGDLKTEKGSLVASKNVVVGEYLEVNAFPKYGQGQAKLWFVQDGKSEYKSDSLYLQDGNFRTQEGSIFAAKDLHAGRHLVLESQAEFGLGSAKLWYAKTGKDGFASNTIYLDSADLNVHQGSITAAKDVTAGRFVSIGAYPGFGSGQAKLWYSQVGKGEHLPESLYLQGGDLRTEDGSFISGKDIHATRYLAVKALSGYGSGEAQLWFSETARGKYAANSLYLKKGDLRTEDGSIVSSQDIEASRFLTLNAMAGFGTGKASLWYCNEEKQGYQFNSLYLKAGDFRTEQGSIIASKDLVATERLKISAAPGYGQGQAELWYSQTGRDSFNSNTLYLTHGDLRTQEGSIHAGKDLSAGRYLEVRAWPGHGSGAAQLWHGKKEGEQDTALYLKEGDLQTQAGSLISSRDITVGRFVQVGATEGFGTGSAKLWYSRTGKGAVTPNTLHLESGDFHTQTGSMHAAEDVVAGGSLKADKLDVRIARIQGAVEAGHLFLGSAKQEESMLETTELIDEGEPVDVHATVMGLDGQLKAMSESNAALKNHLDSLMAKINLLERSL
jgi:hypothetical protein